MKLDAAFERTDWVSFGLTTFLMLAIYGLTLNSEIGLTNSGIYAVGSMYAGVPHPPGYPLTIFWQLLFIKLLPVSNVAWRCAVSSATAGALSCGLIAIMVSKLGATVLEQVQSKLSAREQHWLRATCGMVAGTLFGLNGSFWPRAVVVDVWPLSILLLSAVLCLLTRWNYKPESRKYIYAAAFVYGLTLTNSQIELALAPAIPFLVWSGDQRIGRDLFLAGSLLFVAGLIGMFTHQFPWLPEYGPGMPVMFEVVGGAMTLIGIGLAAHTRQAFSEWKALLMLSASFLLGLAAYFYLPIASMTNPPMNWGYSRTVEGFFHVLSRGQYEQMQPTGNLAVLMQETRDYFSLAAKEFGWPGLLSAAVPICFFRRIVGVGRRWMLAVMIAYVCLAGLMIAVLNPASDRQSLDLVKTYYSASYVTLALLTGVGLICFGGYVTRSGEQSRAVSE